MIIERSFDHVQQAKPVFIDYNQNAKDRTVAGEHSLRPTPAARVRRRSTGRRSMTPSPATLRA
jgi:DNA primase